MTPQTTTGGSRVRAALAELLAERPGAWVNREDVCRRLGYEVSRSAVSKAATQLGCEGARGRLGGYRGGHLPAAPRRAERKDKQRVVHTMSDTYPEVPW